MNDRRCIVEKNLSTSSVPYRLAHQMRRIEKWRNTLNRETPRQLFNSHVISSRGSVLFGTVVEKSPEITLCPLSGDFSTPPRWECTVGVAVEMTEDSFNKRGGSSASWTDCFSIPYYAALGNMFVRRPLHSELQPLNISE